MLWSSFGVELKMLNAHQGTEPFRKSIFETVQFAPRIVTRSDYLNALQILAVLHVSLEFGQGRRGSRIAQQVYAAFTPKADMTHADRY